MPVLRKLPTPQLWILGKEDIDAPYLETHRRLSSLRQAGTPISIVTYPDAEHGLYLFETKGEERLSTQQPPSLQRLLADFARGEPLATRYDDAAVIR
jgi:pimeloyl-ACP methyl ester carboxylesterase